MKTLSYIVTLAISILSGCVYEETVAEIDIDPSAACLYVDDGNPKGGLDVTCEIEYRCSPGGTKIKESVTTCAGSTSEAESLALEACITPTDGCTPPYCLVRCTQ